MPEKLPEPVPHVETVVEEEEEEQPPPIIRDPNLQLHPLPMMECPGDVPFDARKGEPAPRGVELATFGAVTKYCYKYAPRELMQPMATAYFDADKIYRRDWDLSVLPYHVE